MADVRRRLASAGALAMLTLAACGGSDGNSDTATTGTTRTTATTGTTGGGTTTFGTTGGGSTATTSAAGVDLASRVMTFTGLSQAHTQDPVTYPQTPPVGGAHFPVWMNCGFYPQPVQTELAVHSMEHGAAWITYRPNLPADEVAVLRDLARMAYVLVSPWRDNSLPAPVVASAWGVQLKADIARDPAVRAFVALYANGPQTPEKGAPCTGGFGTPA